MFRHLTTIAAGAATMAMFATAGQADEITLRVSAGHPPVVPYLRVAEKEYFPTIEKRVAAETGHTIRYVKAYAGTAVPPNRRPGWTGICARGIRPSTAPWRRIAVSTKGARIRSCPLCLRRCRAC